MTARLPRRVRHVPTRLAATAIAGAVAVTTVGLCLAAAPPAPAPASPHPPSAAKETTTMAKPDYAKLALAGDARTQDHFSLAVCAAARLLGREADYETVYALSTNVFAPAIQPREDCMSWWNLYGRAEALDLVAAALGLEAKPLDLPDLKLSPADSPEVFAQKTARQRELYPRLIRAAMDKGGIVLAEGGWKGNGPHGFLAWGWWGIITAAPDGGAILGATLNGYADNPLEYVPACYVLTRAGAPLARDEADARMLRLAVERIRGTGRFKPGRSLFGLAAMDRWIAQMATVPGFCPGCHQQGQRGWTDAADNAVTFAASARVAALYLRSRAPAFPEGARPHLEQAARGYDRIQALLQPALSGKGGENYQQFIGDLTKQKAHADIVLKPVREELVAVAAALEQALPATGARVVLDNVLAIAARIGERTAKEYYQTRGVIAARAICLEAAGCTNASYETLMAVSGFATAFAYHPTKFWFVYFGPLPPEDTDALIGQATGRLWQWTPRGATPEETWGKLKALIDAGTPVEGEHLNEVLFVGYQDAAKPEGRKVMICGPFEWQAEWWSWQQFSEWWQQFHGHCHLQHVGAATAPGDAAKLGVEVMRNMVTFAAADGRAKADFMGMKEGKYGSAALEAFAADVADDTKPPESFDGGWLGCHAINLQSGGRRCAAVYLESLARLFPGDAGGRIRAAAKEYGAAFASWQEFSRQLGYGAGSGDLESLKKLWRDPARRRAGAAAIRGALGHEHLAVEALAQAIETQPPKEKGVMTSELKHDGGKVWIDGVDQYRYIDPMFEGVRIILAQRGEPYSAAYVQGLAGAAFRIGGICPCAPTCDVAMSEKELVALLGYEYEHLGVAAKGEAQAADTQKLVARVRQEVDAGRAVLVWHAFTNAEWDVVYGYDAQKKTLLGHGSHGGEGKPYVEAPEGRTGTCGEICDPLGAVVIGRRARAFDAPTAELAALKAAVQHARSQVNVDKVGGKDWVMLHGLACYDRWIRDWQDPKRKLGLGDCYCIGVYSSTHAAAAPFLREIAPRHPRAQAHLLAAAQHFELEAAALKDAKKHLWWSAPEGPDAARNAAAVKVLQQARDAYAAGIGEIEQALAAPP